MSKCLSPKVWLIIALVLLVVATIWMYQTTSQVDGWKDANGEMLKTDTIQGFEPGENVADIFDPRTGAAEQFTNGVEGATTTIFKIDFSMWFDNSSIHSNGWMMISLLFLGAGILSVVGFYMAYNRYLPSSGAFLLIFILTLAVSTIFFIDSLDMTPDTVARDVGAVILGAGVPLIYFLAPFWPTFMLSNPPPSMTVIMDGSSSSWWSSLWRGALGMDCDMKAALKDANDGTSETQEESRKQLGKYNKRMDTWWRKIWQNKDAKAEKQKVEAAKPISPEDARIMEEHKIAAAVNAQSPPHASGYSAPKCVTCGGTGKVSWYILGTDKCTVCGGTGTVSRRRLAEARRLAEDDVDISTVLAALALFILSTVIFKVIERRFKRRANAAYAALRNV